MSRMNNWFVPGDGIAREVITADVQRYLGPDALVRPGLGTAEYEGRPGYWITAYRTLTSQMIQDLKLDSQRWQAEKDREHGRAGVAYQDSRTHASRQHYGPSESYASQPKQPTYAAPGYPTETQQHYTTAPAAASYGAAHPGYQPPPSHYQPTAEPRTYTTYAQPSGGRADYPGYSTTPQYSHGQQPAQPVDSYGRPTQPSQYSTVPSSGAAPGFYIASDGRQYPLSQQPQQQQQQQRRRQ